MDRDRRQEIYHRHDTGHDGSVGVSGGAFDPVPMEISVLPPPRRSLEQLQEEIDAIQREIEESIASLTHPCQGPGSVTDSFRDFELGCWVAGSALDSRPRLVPSARVSATRSATDEQARHSLSARSSQQPIEMGGAYAGASGVMSATTSASYTTEVGGEGIATIPTVMAPASQSSWSESMLVPNPRHGKD